MSNNGWIRLHRKIMGTPEWLAEPFTRGQAWVDLLLLANHAPGYIRRRGILIEVERGQVGHSEEALAARWSWSRGKVRRFLSELTRLCRISRKISEKTVQKNTSVSSLIYIVNYDRYQVDSTENGTEDGRKTVPEQKEKKEKYSPNEISEKIAALKSRYQNQDLLNRAIDAIASTRKSNRIADSVVLKHLEKWSAYPADQVETGIRTYLEKNYAADGKGEAYLLGIIRNGGNGGRPAEPQPVVAEPKEFDFDNQFKSE